MTAFRKLPRLFSRLALPLAVGSGALLAASACRRPPPVAAETSTSPTVRLYVLSSVAGALEPCGCTKDQLGGVDHAAALLRSGTQKAPHSVVVGAGPMLFQDPQVDAVRAKQDSWKAEALAASLGDLGLVAWAPGANDWSRGAEELERLSKVARADLLAGNVKSPAFKSTRIVNLNGHKIGIAGVSDPSGPLGRPSGVELTEARAALQASRDELTRQGAEVRVALVAADRGQVLRLVEQVPGYQVVVAGKAYDKGEGNDAPVPPTLVDSTLVVESPNHLQGIAIVDLYLRGDGTLRDGSGIADLEKRASLESRRRELERRIGGGAKEGASDADLTARKAELDRVAQQLSAMKDPAPPASGSYFRYRFEEVRQRAGSVPEVEHRLGEYYQRVNDYNREAFKDRKPKPVAAGEASYVGAQVCSNCHAPAFAFWQTTGHSRAYGTLSVQHKEFNLDCVSCHVTGYDKPGGSTVTFVDKLENVQCEVCHGPGSRHADRPEDETSIVRHPQKTICAATCHHPPHVADDWNVDAVFAKIIGKGHGQR